MEGFFLAWEGSMFKEERRIEKLLKSSASKGQRHFLKNGLKNVRAIGGAAGAIQKGKLFVLDGKAANSWFTDGGVGIGLDGGAEIVFTEYYYLNLSGEHYDFTIEDHNGERYSVTGDVNIYGILSLGVGFAIAPVRKDIYIISRSTSIGVGVEGTAVSGNVNYGSTTLTK
jgi:hypothetical protein